MLKMTSKIFAVALSLAVVFGACKKEEDVLPNGMNKSQKSVSCEVVEPMTSVEFGEFTAFDNKAVVKIAEGITITRQGNDATITFSPNVPRGTVTVASRHGQVYKKYTLNTECMKGTTYALDKTNVSDVRYGEFIPDPYRVTIVDLEGNELITLPTMVNEHGQTQLWVWAAGNEWMNAYWANANAIFKVAKGLEVVLNEFVVLEGIFIPAERTHFTFSNGDIKSDLVITALTREVPVQKCKWTPEIEAALAALVGDGSIFDVIEFVSADNSTVIRLTIADVTYDFIGGNSLTAVKKCTIDGDEYKINPKGNGGYDVKCGE